MTIQRNPGEDLAAFYNRKLAARGVTNREWYYGPGGEMRMRDCIRAQSKLEFEGQVEEWARQENSQ